MDRRQTVLVGLLMGALACSKEDSSSSGFLASGREPLEISGQQKIQAVPGIPGQRFGAATALGQTQLLVGASQETVSGRVSQGAVYAFGRSGSSIPQQQRIVASDGTQNAFFGLSLGVSGGTLVVGAPGIGNFQVGSAYVFTFTGSTWSEQQKLVAADGAQNQSFGTSVAVLGDNAFVAAGSGVYVFARSGAVWSQTHKIPRAPRIVSASLAVSGDTLLVGHGCDPDEATTPCRGAVFVYARTGAQWLEQQKLVPSERQAGDVFGISVALSGNRALIGASGRTVGGRVGQGAAYLFDRVTAGFAEQQQLVAVDGVAHDQLGLSVALDGEVALVGAPGHEHAGENSDHGSAYVFARSGATFVQDRELRASDGQNNDAFGTSVSLSGGLALIGAPNDDGPLTGQGSAQVVTFQGASAQPCTLGSECASGFCSDGRCCNAACDGACNACSVAAGAARDGECTLVGGSSPGAAICAPLTCNGQSTACARCASDADCGPGTYCDASGACQPRKELGRACEPGFDCKVNDCRICQSGHCVDGVCCNETCTNGCSSCSALLTGASPGSCAPVRAGTDPKNACAQDPGFPESCGGDGECNGASACRTVAPLGTRCGNLTCGGGTATEFSCDSTGNCAANALECGGGTGGSGGSGTGGSAGASGGSSGSATGGTSTGGAGGTSGSGGSGTGGTGGGGDACIRVSPDGDDAEALLNDGATPFQSLQLAIDFTFANPTIADQVCVATGSYDGPSGAPLRMRNGISVLGGYDAATWARVPGGRARLRPQTAEGVVFSSEIDGETALDGFDIEAPQVATATGVVVDGAHGAVVADVSIDLSSDVDLAPRLQSYGVDVRNGADVTLTGTDIVAHGTRDCAGLRSNASRLVFLDGSVDVSSGVDGDEVDPENVLRAAEIIDSPGSRIEASELRVEAPSNPFSQLLGVTVTGDSEGIVLAGNAIEHELLLHPSGTGISFTECAGSSPTIADNLVDSALNGIVTGLGCPALIDGNEVHAVGTPNTTSIGIDCRDGCTVLDNDVDVVNTALFSQAPGSVNEGIGVLCVDCVSVTGNDIVGLGQVFCTRNCEFGSRGLVLLGNGTLADANTITAGCSHGPTGGGGSIGVVASGAHRLQNNVIHAGLACPTTQPEQAIAISHGLSVSGPVDVHSNLISAGETVNLVCKSASIFIAAGGALIRNNILVASNCSQGANVEEAGGSSDPAVLENNAFAPGLQILYIDIGTIDPRTVEEVNALGDIASSGNFSAACPLPLSGTSACVDKGTPTGAPDHDRNGNARSTVSPDVGPEEWGDLSD
jgi:hypothetical protein